MEAPSATTASASHPSPNPTVFQALAAPIHRKARILTRDPLREADDSMELQAEDDVRRLVVLKNQFSLLLFSMKRVSVDRVMK